MKNSITRAMRVILTFICFASIFQANAYHIIGGEVTSRCLGSGEYEITIIMYRDCSTILGADFDSNPGEPIATATVWRDDMLEPFIRTVKLDAPKVTRLNPSDMNPCMIIPPNICVEKGVYKVTLRLPRSEHSYHFVYQRCCRNATIMNILFPNEVGATFEIEITPEAQKQCVDSPVFNKIPPMVMCVGQPIRIDQSVRDVEPNTTIEYALCAAYVGGGPLGTELGENRFGPDGITPDPNTRPPYDEVTYITGYDAQNPLKADPQIRIDPVTGFITGTPNVTGQYVVAICIQQKRNGIVLSELRREFQFNIVDCIPQVEAKIDAREVNEKEYSLLQCGNRTVHLKNNSIDEEFISSYEWVVRGNGVQNISHQKDFTYTFPDTGIYEIKMYLNKDIAACDDSARIVVEVRDGIESSFAILGDSCDAGAPYVENNSFSDNGLINAYDWFFEEGNKSTEREPDFKFGFSGHKDVLLAVRDKYGCTDSTYQKYAFFPRPLVVDVSLLEDLLCTNSPLSIMNNSYPLDSSYQVNWYVSNGDLYTGLEPTFYFEEPGVYDLTLEIISPIGCLRSDEYPGFFDIRKKPVASFEYEPEELSQFEKSVNFINFSDAAAYYTWLFDVDGTSTAPNPFFTFPDTGYKAVTLFAIAENGCADSITHILDIEPLATYYLPTAFTPDGDGINDGYRGEGYFPYISDFAMKIYTRWGEEVFTTDNTREEWNGKIYNTGKLLPQGVYVVKVRFRTPRGKVVEKKTFVTLLD